MSLNPLPKIARKVRSGSRHRSILSRNSHTERDEDGDALGLSVFGGYGDTRQSRSLLEYNSSKVMWN